MASLPLRRCGIDFAWISVMISNLASFNASQGWMPMVRKKDWSLGITGISKNQLIKKTWRPEASKFQACRSPFVRAFFKGSQISSASKRLSLKKPAWWIDFLRRRAWRMAHEETLRLAGYTHKPPQCLLSVNCSTSPKEMRTLHCAGYQRIYIYTRWSKMYFH